MVAKENKTGAESSGKKAPGREEGREREIKEKTQGDRKGKRKPSEVTAL